MYTSRPTTSASRRSGGGDGHGASRMEPLYALDELDVLREELLEAYSVPREKMITRDQVNEIKRTDFAMKETEKITLKKAKEEDIILQLKAKQEALRRLYETVLIEKKQEKERKKKRKKGRTESEGSFHALYTVYHDPDTGVRDEIPRGKEDDEEREAIIKVIESTKQSPIEPVDRDSNLLALGKERSKFVLKQKSLSKSKPPPLLPGDKDYKRKVSITKEVLQRRDARYSSDHDRYSFDVDVHGPFVHYDDPDRILPEMRNVGTQALIVEGALKGPLMEDFESQTELDDTQWNPNRYSFASDRTGVGGIEDIESEEDDEETHAGGDASSSNPSSDKEEAVIGEKTDEEGEEDEEPGKTLERKESKRREAETMARPRGYRDLDLNQQMAFVTFEAETHVTAYDLEKELAKQRGFVLSKDNILWPTCAEFDIDTASTKIQDYIKRCWDLDPKWLFFVQPLEVYHDNYRKKYVFEVKFSVPSPSTPVPPATASVFFVFEISLYAGKDDKVKVTYVLEGTRFAHKPGRVTFQDKWLWGIITDKLRVQKAVNF